MYELVKQKSWGIRILSGLAIFFVIAQVLKFMFQERETSTFDMLMKTASALNRNAPITIDSMTRFDNALALSDNRIQFTYTFPKIVKTQVDTILLQQENRKEILNRIKTTPEMSFFVENNVDVIAKYYDKEGNYICTLNISHNDYK